MNIDDLSVLIVIPTADHLHRSSEDFREQGPSFGPQTSHFGPKF